MQPLKLLPSQSDDPLVQALREIVREIVAEELHSHQQPRWNWLTTIEAGELLGISPHRVSARVRQGTLPGRKYGGRTYVDRAELEAQIARGRR